MAVLPVLLAITLLASSAVAQDYPMCPSGSMPSKPNVTVTRCLDAAEFSCCKDCRDKFFAFRIISANGTTVLNQISPGLGKILGGKDLRICGLLAGFPQCAVHLEQITCALGCNPDLGNYVKQGTDARTLYLCSDYAAKVFGYCKSLELPGFGTISSFFPTKEQLFTVLVAAFASSNTFSDKGNFTAKIVNGTEGCYSGPKILPPVTACCDPMDTPGVCLTGEINTMKYPEFLPFVNQTTLPANCKDQLPPAPAPTGSKGGSRMLASARIAFFLAIACSILAI